MNLPKKVMILAPFWENPQHVGCYRVDRFIRWLKEKSVEIILVKAGQCDTRQKKEWGIEITVKDPLGIYGDMKNGKYSLPQRRPNRLRRMMSYLLLCPDPTIVWAIRATLHPMVLKEGKGVDSVIASSPPESAHIGAYLIAKRLHADLIVDMRDGWLDEPLKPLLQSSRFRQKIEGYLEKCILQEAKHIFVTSEVWKSLLEKRLPFTKKITTVLTNAFPKSYEPEIAVRKQKKSDGEVILAHTGRFSGSRDSQKPKLLLESLFQSIDSLLKGKILILGNLNKEDIDEINAFKSMFGTKGWMIEIRNALPRNEMMKVLYESDGLLLLSASQAAIPSKLFEYIITKKPILAVTMKDSAVWQIGERVPQMFLSDYTDGYSNSEVNNFIQMCSSQNHVYKIIKEFAENRISQIFYEKLNL